MLGIAHTSSNNQAKRPVQSGPDFTTDVRCLGNHLPYWEGPVLTGPYHMISHVTLHDLFVDQSPDERSSTGIIAIGHYT